MLRVATGPLNGDWSVRSVSVGNTSLRGAVFPGTTADIFPSISNVLVLVFVVAVGGPFFCFSSVVGRGREMLNMLTMDLCKVLPCRATAVEHLTTGAFGQTNRGTRSTQHGSTSLIKQAEKSTATAVGTC